MSERLRPPLTAPPAEWAKPDIVFNPLRLPPLPPVADATLLEQALTHKSSLTGTHVADPDPNVRERVEFDCNRRLEWAGDALFTWLVTEELFVRFPSATAGDLSILRQRLISNRTISHLAWAYGFGSALRCSHDNTRTRTGLVHQKIFADAFEAYLSAVAHAGAATATIDTLRSYIRRLLGPDCAEGLSLAAAEMRTRRLQGETEPLSPGQQVTSLKSPSAGETDGSGPLASAPSNQPTSSDVIAWSDRTVHNGWLSSLLVDDRVMATGHASKRVESRQRAMNNLLVRLSQHPPTRDLLLTAADHTEETT
ncbi:hypothetical protein BMF94_4532 [Rhodotorula taiwanensis]|uniref:RNase III domain-containing protein n=1 Tax=Rhodotorula taiwanensis TaxID=741276 RepID=A0A2S5B7E9_9BASI|nr:hypothetical protein BMF94_4532 [Rhodotorula taiwanensis]